MGYKKRADQRPALFQMLSDMEYPHRISSFPVKGEGDDPVFSY